MTGDIRTKLKNSDALKAMAAEANVKKCFLNAEWEADQGLYYRDAETGKLREIDVLARRAFTLSKHRRYTGVPLINISLPVECKSLSGTNLMFFDQSPMRARRSTSVYHIQSEHVLGKLVLAFARKMDITDRAKLKALYEYALARAHPYDDRYWASYIDFELPAVDTESNVMRETKDGRLVEDSSAKSEHTPVWNTILSVSSCVRALRNQIRKAQLSYLKIEPKLDGRHELVDLWTFFLDAEIMRISYFHSVIILRSRLWRTDGADVSEVQSARLRVQHADGDEQIVDFVRDDHVETYVGYCCTKMLRAANRSLLRVNRVIQDLGWISGAEAEVVYKIIGSSRYAASYAKRAAARRQAVYDAI